MMSPNLPTTPFHSMSKIAQKFLYLCFYENRSMCSIKILKSNRTIFNRNQLQLAVWTFFKILPQSVFVRGHTHVQFLQYQVDEFMHQAAAVEMSFLSKNLKRQQTKTALMSWKNGDPSQNTLCHSTTKKNLLQLVPHLATSSKILQCKIIVVQTCKNEKHQLDVMICWTNMLHLGILPTYLILVLHTYLCMHGVYP